MKNLVEGANNMEHVQVQNVRKGTMWSVKALTMIGLMSAISFLLMFYHRLLLYGLDGFFHL